MRVKEIVIDGFKSYAKRTVIGNWDTQFNCITGLNGSGKSNILDAICFVLGITTMSTVRASNQQDLIYKRGQAGVTKANVSIVFDNSDKAKSPLDYRNVDTITVTRQVVLGGTSKYLINGHRAQQNQVQRLFQEVQLNVNNPNFLIMQGQITKVVNMQPTEILGLIEEAAGTGLYEKERQKAVREIHNRDGTLLETEALVNEEVRPRLEKLREKKRQFLEYQQCAASTAAAERVVAASEYTGRHAELRELAAAAESQATRTEELKARVAQATADQAAGAEQLEQLKLQQHSADSHRLEAALQSASEEQTRLLGDLEHRRAQLELAESQREAGAASVDRITQALQSHHASVEGFEAEHARLQSRVAEQHKLVAEKRELLTGLQTGISSTGERETGYAYTCKKARQAVVEAQNRLAALTTEHQKLTSAAPVQQRPELAAAVARDEARLQETQAAEQAKRSELAAVGASAQDMARLKAEREDLRDSIATLSRELERLMTQYPNLDIPVDRKDPNWSSIKGRVAHVFNVQAQHQDKLLALETCAGGALWNLVVDNDQVGAAVLKGARKRMTVLPLNRMRTDVLSRAVVAKIDPAAAWLAVDLLEFTEDVRPAVENVFGRTVICATSKIAERAAFQFHIRAVTLAGDIFDPRGVISGGFHKRDPQGSLTSFAAVKQYQSLAERQLEEETALNRVSQQIEEVGQSALVAERTKNELDLLRHELELIETQLSESRERLSEADRAKERASELETKEIPETQAQIQDRTQALERALTDAKEFSANREGKLQQLQQEVEQLASQEQTLNDELETRSAKHSRNQFELAKLKADLVQETEAKESAVLAVKELSDEIHDLTQQQAANQQQLTEIDAQLKAELERVSSVRADVRSLEQQQERLNNEIAEMKLELQRANHSLEAQEEAATAARAALAEVTKRWPNARELAEAPNATLVAGNELQQLKHTLSQGQRRMRELSQRVDSGVLSTIQRLENDEALLRNRLEMIKEDRRKLEELMQTLSERRRETINNVWRQVSTDFGLIFGDLLPNSSCELVPVDNQPIEKGFSIKVRLGATWKEGLTELSGGQRSLVALSLILALLRYHPAPMYILDEVDAALDVHHTSNIGHIIKTRFKNAQFIVVSLKDDMFTNANRIYQTRFIDGTSTVAIVA